MTYFSIICSTNKFHANLVVSEVLITYVANFGKARVMLHIGAGHNNNCQIILKYTKSAKFCLLLLPLISDLMIIQLRGYFGFYFKYSCALSSV